MKYTYVLLVFALVHCGSPDIAKQELQVSITNKQVLKAISLFEKKYYSTMGKEIKIMNLHYSSRDCSGGEIMITSTPDLLSNIMLCPIDKFALVDSSIVLIRGNLKLSEWDEKRYESLIMSEFPLNMVINDWDFEKREPVEFRNFNQLAAKYAISDTVVETTTAEWLMSKCDVCDVPPKGGL